MTEPSISAGVPHGSGTVDGGQRLRILQVSDGYPPVIGGVETYVKNLSHALRDAGHEVLVATLARGDLPRRHLDGGVEVRRLRGVTQHLPGAGHDAGQVFHPPVPDPPIVRQLQAIIEEFRPDVIHAHGWMMHSCLPLRRGPAALVVHLHEWGISCVKKTMVTSTGTCEEGPALTRCTSCAAEQYRGKARAGLLAAALRAERPLYRRVDAFVAPSSAVAAGARPVIPYADRLSVVPNAVPDGLPEEAATTPPPEWLPSGAFLLFVGVLGPHKGLDVLIEARTMTRSRLPLVMLGSRRSDTPSFADDLLVRHDVPHNVVMACWQRASIGVVPSFTESFGLVAVECQSVGTPVIVSSAGGLVDVVQDGVNGLVVPPRDAASLARAIDRLAFDPGLSRALGEAGRRGASRFSMSTVLPQLRSVYERALAGRGVHRAVSGLR